MEEEEIDLDSSFNNESSAGDGRADKRFRDLSEKVKLTAQERDELAEAKAKAEAETVVARKEVEFYSSFADSASQYPGASEYKDAIKEKVMAGYTVEDATVSVLAKEGKLTSSPSPRPDSPAGGSATTALKGSGEKSATEMTQAERLEALTQMLG